MSDTKKTIFFVSTFPPRECGLATFTNDLIQSFEKIFSPFITTKVIAMNDGGRNFYVYPAQKVVFQIQQDKKEEYIEAANFVNQEKPALVCIQHEFGIFGGRHGAYIVKFLKRIQKPRVVILHTVIPTPDSTFQKRVEELGQVCELFIVMTESSKNILIKDYMVASDKIVIIPHGIPAVPFESSRLAKKAFGLERYTVLTTFGLLSRNKGIEYVLQALPAVVKLHPNILYLVVGATHPNVLKKEGEEYRKSLFMEAKKLGLEKHVRFYNKYFILRDLLRVLRMTDIYIATSLDPNQAVSGTLSYAIGTGRPAVSTNFSQAQEFVTKALGKLVPVQDALSYSEAILSLLSQPEKLTIMGEKAYSTTRHMVWSNVATAYHAAFLTLAPSLATSERRLFPVKLSHFEQMTTERGILQFCRWAVPLSASGYTLDDNARALFVMAFYQKHTENKKTPARLASIYLNFLLSRDIERDLLMSIFSFEDTPDTEANKENREDAHTRALLALSFVGAQSELPAPMRVAAQEKFAFLLKNARTSFSSPRAQALFIKALSFQLSSLQLSKEDEKKYLEMMETACGGLAKNYQENISHDWRWFEPLLAYSNASLPEALFLGSFFCHSSKFLKVAEESLHFLLEHTIKNGQASPIGQAGWLRKGGKRAHHDQQPEEIASLISCLRTAWDITGDMSYERAMKIAFSWFLGNNTLGQMMYDEVTGGCYDGLAPHSVNLNQGSESTICYLHSRLHVAHSPFIVNAEEHHL